MTQGFHMPRALFLADEAGIHATGLTSDLHRYGYQLKKSEVREVLSRVKAIADVTLDTPAMAGPSIPISTTDGRESWGPVPPPGTPPAGSPAAEPPPVLSRPEGDQSQKGLAAVVQGVDVEALVGGPVGVPVAAFVAARP